MKQINRMDPTLKKCGTTSILLGSFHYKSFISEQPNKLLKITKRDDRHDEFRHLDKVREISQYTTYYSIPEESEYLLQPTDFFYEYLERLMKIDDCFTFGETLYCRYIPWAGNQDLHDTIIELDEQNSSTIWTSCKTILQFSKQMINALAYLHEKKLCHLDIKPENIVITDHTHFKIIDFGYSSVEPFDDYVKQVRGTPEYFPMDIPGVEPTRTLPKIEANDAILVDGEMPMVQNRNYVYKIDSYCLGRTLQMLFVVFMDSYIIPCFSFETSTIRKINKIIEALLENDVHKRVTILECREKYF